MSNKREIILVLIGLIITFAAGRYLAESPDVSLSELQVSHEKIHEDKDTHTQTKIVTQIQPSGVKTITTTIDQVTTDAKQTQDDTKTQVKETVSSKSRLNVSGIVGLQLGSDMKPVYGVSVSKQFLGPVTVGGVGLTNGVLGVTIGLDF